MLRIEETYFGIFKERTTLNVYQIEREVQWNRMWKRLQISLLKWRVQKEESFRERSQEWEGYKKLPTRKRLMDVLNSLKLLNRVFFLFVGIIIFNLEGRLFLWWP